MKVSRLTVALFAVWVVCLVVAFWWAVIRPINRVDFDLAAASFNAIDELYGIPTNGGVTIAHFIDDSCSCSRFSKPHIKEIKARLSSDTNHLSVTRNARTADIPQGIKLLADKLPASPATAIWNEQGALTYFGPYSAGAFCGEGQDMVTYTVERLKTNPDFTWLSQEYIGCLCPWQETIDKS